MSFRKKRAPSPAEMDRRLHALRRVDLFSGASEDDLERLAHGLREREVSAGTEVVREGRLPTHVFVIMQGGFEVISRGEKGGKPRVVNVLGEGEHFGEIGLIEGMPATATVSARGSARIAEIPGEAFLSFVDRSSSLTSVADRISTWLARTHPSYRPSAEGGVAPEGALGRVTELLRRWEEAEVKELEAGLRQLEALDPERRRQRLRDLGD